MSFPLALHHFVEHQLPEYIRSEFPQYVLFIRKYYEFLDQADGPNGRLASVDQWRDIDSTLDLFVDYYRKQYAWDFPESAVVDTRRLIKYIHDYYETKGSEDAAQIFFRLLFDVEITAQYPNQFVLRASDGQWSRKRYVKLDTSVFQLEDAHQLTGKRIQLSYLEFVPNVGNLRRSVEVSCFSAVRLSEANIFLLDVDLSVDYVFPPIISPDPSVAPSMGLYDSHIYVSVDGVYYGSLSRQLIQVRSLLEHGSDFRVGDSYTVGELGVIGVFFAENYMVDNDDYVFQSFNNTAIVRVDELRTEYNSGTNTVPGTGEVYQLRLLTTGQRFACRRVIGEAEYFSEDFVIDPVDYAVTPEATVPVNGFTIEIPSRRGGDPIEVEFETGFVYVTPGGFADNRGTLSDIVATNDNDYYQSHSYVLQTPISTERWKPYYLRSNHPAGMKVFSEVVTSASVFVTSPSISTTLRPDIFITDTVPIVDEVMYGVVIEPPAEQVWFGDTEEEYFSDIYLENNDSYSYSFYSREDVDLEDTTP
jgi:hypothetical protein